MNLSDLKKFIAIPVWKYPVDVEGLHENSILIFNYNSNHSFSFNPDYDIKNEKFKKIERQSFKGISETKNENKCLQKMI